MPYNGFWYTNGTTELKIKENKKSDKYLNIVRELRKV